MKVSKTIVDKLFQEENHYRFDKTFQFENEKYHYFVNNSLFFSQLYRIYSLLARELGVESVEYDYIRKGGKNILFSKSICSLDEILVESDDLDYSFLKPGESFRNDDFMSYWLKVINYLPFKDKNEILNKFYKQYFFAFLINDEDKQISIIKDLNGQYRLGEYFDYGGVYMSQDQNNYVDNDIFYEEEYYNRFLAVYDGEKIYTKEDLDNDLNRALEKSILNFELNDWYKDKLVETIYFLDKEFINKCFSIDIIDVINKDKNHDYSNSFKKVISCMFEKSRNELKKNLEEMQLIESIDIIKKM